MAQKGIQTVPAPIQIKLEQLSDDDEAHCRLCHKAFASPVALRNHVRMDHVEAYESGDPTVWTKSENEPVIKTRSGQSRKEQRLMIQKRKQEIISSMAPTCLTSLASKNVSYLIIKSDDPALENRTRNKKEKEVKKVVIPKKVKTPQAITGPFECLEPSPLGADGACHQMFFSCCAYSLHARTEHARRRRAPRCQVCERPLAARPGDPSAPYVCEGCGEGFETADGLQEHTNKVHVKQKPYECSVCQKRFTQQGGVVQHMRMHSGDRPFPCSWCGKAFTQKSGLDQHMRTHTKLKPYRCVVCAKSFIQSVHLKQHMRTHTNVAPFQCGICDKRFKQSSHLNYHLKNHNPANMTSEQRDKYDKLVGQMKQDEVVLDIEYESQEIEDTEQIIAEHSIQEEEGETYVDGETYEDMQEHFST